MYSLQSSTEAETLNGEEIQQYETSESSKPRANFDAAKNDGEAAQQEASEAGAAFDNEQNRDVILDSSDDSMASRKQLDKGAGTLKSTSLEESNMGDGNKVDNQNSAFGKEHHSQEAEQNAPTENRRYPHGLRAAEAESEFQNIMEQFDQGDPDITELRSSFDDISMSQKVSSSLSTADSQAQHPPRKSSLESRQEHPPRGNNFRIPQHDQGTLSEDRGLAANGEPGIVSEPKFIYSQATRLGSTDASSPKSPLSSASLHKALPPAPEPEPDLPFDFHRFLDQLRHRTADPVAKFLRSFLLEFGKKQWMVHEQVKIISDFLAFITGKMAQCEVWRGVSDAEFDNAKEGMEKLVMNRLYSQTFSPVIPPSVTPVASKERKRGPERRMEPGRRGQHQEDIERDAVLAQKVRIYKWVREEHLDISPVGDSGKRFLILAQQGLQSFDLYHEFGGL